MSETLAQIVYYINGILALLLTYYGFVRTFKPAVKKRWIFLAYTAYLVFASQQFLVFDNIWLNVIVNIVAFSSISLLFIGNLGSKLVFATLVYIISMVADAISFVGLSYIYYAQHGAEIPTIYIYSVVRTVTNIIFLPFFLMFLLLFRRYFTQKASYAHFKVPLKYTISVFVMLTGIIFIDLLFFAVAMKEIRTKGVQIIVSQFLVLLMAFLIIWFYNAMLDYLHMIETSHLKDQMLERWETQYNATMHSQKAISELKHNLRFDFMALAGLLKEGKTGAAERHLQEKLGEISYLINTGNMPIDTMLNYYKQKSLEALSIDLETELKIPSNMRLDAALIVTILGNAFENAIEACNKVETDKRYIHIKAVLTKRDDKGTLLVIITNPYAVEPVADKNGNLLTTKENKQKHGFGLASIREILPEKSGHINFEYGANTFKFALVLYDIECESPPKDDIKTAIHDTCYI